MRAAATQIRADGVNALPIQQARSSGSRIARNLLASMGGQVLTWAATSVLVVILPRYLGDSNLGKLGFATALTGMFGIVIEFGVGTYLPREIARTPSSAGGVAYNALLTRIPGIIISVLAILAFIWVRGYPDTTRNIIYISLGVMALGAFGATLNASLQGLERLTFISAVSVFEKVLLMGLTVGLLVFGGYGLMAYAFALLAALVVSLLVRIIYFWRVVGLSTRIDPAICRNLFRNGLPFVVWSGALMIYSGIDVLMLSLMTEDKVVGWYGVAYRFVNIPAVIPFAVTASLLPTLSAATGDEFRMLARRCLDLVVLTTIPIAFFFLVGAGAVIHFFNYPEGFEHSILLLRILALFGPLAAVGMVSGTVLIAENRERPWARVAIAAAVLNPLANVFLIPIFQNMQGDGAIGAAIATVATEVFMFCWAMRLMEPGTFGRENLVLAGRCLAAGGLMAGAMLLALPFGLFAIFFAGAFTYTAATFALRAIVLDDLRAIPRLLFAKHAPAAEVEPA